MQVEGMEGVKAWDQDLQDGGIEWIDPLRDPAWDACVTGWPEHSVFHRAAWARVLSETYHHRPFYLRIESASSVVLFPLMEVDSPITGRRGVCLPFADFAGPLWRGHPEIDVYSCLMRLVAIRHWKHLEVRGDSGLCPWRLPYQRYQAHELVLGGGNGEMGGGALPPATRRSIHRAERSRLAVAVEPGLGAMVEFFQLHAMTRRRHGLPPQPLAFFESIHRHLVGQGLGAVVLARLDGQTVAGAVFLYSGRRAVMKFAASDSGFWCLRPNHLVMQYGIRHLAALGIESLHFGRTAPGHVGLARFKRSWGADERPLEYYRYDFGRHAWVGDGHRPADGHPLVFGHLPIAINRLAGCLVYPHLD